ncbi:phosphotransferase [Micromonospora maritima]|uniref:phosphotransferase n=1 Tax=Micromonospora maritima TaxID=986711 RepID=UPI00157C1E9C|nr:phosphotransferase [Micromonospora maritima]
MTELDDVLPEIEETLGSTVVAVAPVTGGGYTPARRCRVDLADGRRAFVKAPSDTLTATWLRQELGFYATAKGDFLPAVWGMGQGTVPWLALEFLPSGWPPPWTPESVAEVRAALDALHEAPVPDGLPRLSDDSPFVTGWRRVAEAPERFLSTGACDEAWLTRHLDTLLDVTGPQVLAGSSVLHLDVRSDNTCLTDRGAVLVDWNLAAVGNPQLDLAFWLPSLALETGVPPAEPGLDPGVVAMVAGFFAGFAGEPDIPTAPRVRPFQRAQLRVALPWAARALGLPEPHPR